MTSIAGASCNTYPATPCLTALRKCFLSSSIATSTTLIPLRSAGDAAAHHPSGSRTNSRESSTRTSASEVITSSLEQDRIDRAPFRSRSGFFRTMRSIDSLKRRLLDRTKTLVLLSIVAPQYHVGIYNDLRINIPAYECKKYLI